MRVKDAIKILKNDYKVQVHMDIGEIKPKPWILTLVRGNLLAFHLFYHEDPELPISILNEIGTSLRLPNEWWGKTP
ncbi:MAG: hypothetical protein O9310_09255 [Leptospiraceae bacterium]|jgi:hypothetical protein|nr:hypothetical protein [Leptospiraceae bacterium]